MKNNMPKRALSLALAAALLAGACSGCSKKEDDPTPEATEKPKHVEYKLTDAAVTKDETVFINISPSGEVKKVNVTDRLHTDMPQVRVEDKTDLKDIADVKTFIEPVIKGDKLYWDMDSTDLYYNGVSEKEPPMSVSVKYYLDGEEISPDKLAGKSGDVKMTITVSNKLTKSVKLGGKSYSMQCPMLFIGGMIMPDETFSEVSTDNGVILGDGAHKLVCFMGVPGMSESLGLNKVGLSALGSALGRSSYSVSCKATDFALGNMMFVAVPFSSIRALGFKDVSVSIDGMKDMLADLESLMNSFASLDINGMIQVLYGNAEQIETLINAVGDASKLYEDNKALIDMLNKYITDGNLDALERVLNDLEKIDTDSIGQLANYKPFKKLLTLISKLDKNLGNLVQFTEDYLKIAPIFENINNDLKNAEVKNAIDNLPQTIKKLRSLVNVLRQSEDLLKQTTKVFNSESIKKIMDFTNSLETNESLNKLTKAQAAHLAERMQAWLDFGESYSIFTQRTSKQTTSVVFVYKAEAI